MAKEEKVYVMPATYEEAVQRKQELLDKINAYNEAMFAGEELPYSDKEIDELQEEYQILNDRLFLTDSEKIDKLNDEDKIINEDGTVERKLSFLDKVHWPLFVYPIFLIIFALGAFHNKIVDSVINNYVFRLMEIAFNHNIYTGAAFKESEFALKSFGYYFRLIFFSSLVQLIAAALSWIGYVIYAIFKKENKKIAFFIAVGISAIALISIIACCVKSFDAYGQVYHEQSAVFDYYVQSLINNYGY